jgi:hypothetical protein
LYTRCDRVKIIVSSREGEDISQAFSPLPQLRLEAETVTDDIRLFVTEEMERRPKLRRLKPATKVEAIAALSMGADGV